MRVLILSGISGSGKSTYVEKLRQEAEKTGTKVMVVSADHFFEKGGEYKFDHTKLGEAHAACLRSFLSELDAGRIMPKILIVDNTNTTDLEMAPYYAIAKAFSAEVELVTLLCNPKVAAARNKHGVPLASCEAMDRRIRNNMPDGKNRRVPPFWHLTSNTVIETS